MPVTPDQLQIVEVSPDVSPLARRPSAELTTGALIKLALEKQQNPTELYRILSEERERQAKGEYAMALARLQARVPEIPLSKHVRASREGGLTFDYAPLETILAVLRPELELGGMSVRWTGRTYVEGGRLLYEATAILIHSGGYEAQSTFAAPVNEGQKGLQPDQCVARTATLCIRNAMMHLLGLRAGVPTESDREPEAVIAEADARDLHDAVIGLSPVGKEVETIKRFCGRFNVSEISEIPDSRLEEAWATIEKAKA